MPNVPRYDQNQVQETSSAPIRANSDLPSSFSGESLNKVFSATNDVITTAKNHADQVAMMEADKKLTELETSLLYDPQNGALNKKGKDSFNLPGDVSQSYNDSAKKIEESLSNPLQRAAFQKLAQDRGLSINRTIDRHVSNEIRQYDDAETNSYIDTQRNFAMASYDNPDLVSGAIEKQKVAMAAYAQRNGMPPEFIKLKTEQIESGTHSSVIQRMVDQDQDLAARKYFENNKDKLKGNDLAQIERLVEASSLRGESQRKSEDIYTKGLSMTDAIAEARKIEEPKLQDETVRRVRELYGLKKVAEQQDREDLTRKANEIILSGKEIPQSMKLKMTASDVASLDTYAKRRREGAFVTTNINTYSDLMTMASNPDTRDEFMRMDLTDPSLLNKLDDGDRKHFIGMQTELRKGNTKQLDGYRSDMQIIGDTLDQIKIKDKDKRALFQKRADEQYQQFIADNGRKPNNKEMQDIADDLTIKVVTDKGWLWDTKVRKYELTGKEAEISVANIDDIPKSEANQIEAALKKYNKPVTQDSIVSIYNSKLQRNQKGR